MGLNPAFCASRKVYTKPQRAFVDPHKMVIGHQRTVANGVYKSLVGYSQELPFSYALNTPYLSRCDINGLITLYADCKQFFIFATLAHEQSCQHDNCSYRQCNHQHVIADATQEALE